MELETDLRKQNVPIASGDTPIQPNVTPTRTLRSQNNRSLDESRKKTQKKGKKTD